MSSPRGHKGPGNAHVEWERRRRPDQNSLDCRRGKESAFRAMGSASTRLWGFPINLSGREVRNYLLVHGREHPELFQGHGVGDWEQFLQDTANDNVWGGEAQILVAASAFKCSFCVHGAGFNLCYGECGPTWHLLYNGVHYDYCQTQAEQGSEAWKEDAQVRLGTKVGKCCCARPYRVSQQNSPRKAQCVRKRHVSACWELG